MRIVFLDCSAGIAGDMLLGALLDLGADVDDIRRGLASLGLDEPWRLEVEPAVRRGIAGLRVRVEVDGRPADAAFTGGGLTAAQQDPPGHEAHGHEPHSHEPHGHDFPTHHHEVPLHGHSSPLDPHGEGLGPHSHPPDANQHAPHAHHAHHAHHEHLHHHDHEQHHHRHHPHRPYRVIRELIANSELPERVKARAQAVFWSLAEAEGGVHGVPPAEVHFHEVGSTDAIIDVVGCCLALEALGVEALEASPLHLGRGYVRAAHGRMPVPAPATLRLVAGLSAYQTDIEGELTTPTGAALVRGLCRRVGPMPILTIERVGHGAGARDGVLPNVVRAVLGETVAQGAAAAAAQVTGAATPAAPAVAAPTAAATTGAAATTAAGPDDEVVELACNLDDATPQLLGALLENLLAHGALDAWIAPVLMKKGRPGHVLHALAPPEQAAMLTERLLRESTSLGVRSLRAERRVLEREWRSVSTTGGEVRIKIGRRGSDIYNLAPEYEDCVAAARAAGLPLKRILDEAKAQAQALWERTADGG